MQFPVTRVQLRSAIESYGFRPQQANRLINDMEGSGRIDLSGSMLSIPNPTDPDAPMIIGLAQSARGGASGSVGWYKVKEYLDLMSRKAATRGASSRG